MYRAGLESILGFCVHGAALGLAPCIPEHWPRVEISHKRGSTSYEILIDNPSGVSHGIVEKTIDGIVEPLTGSSATVPGALTVPDSVSIPWVDDGAIHRVRLVLGAPGPPA
jgi:cyclic beta-1,2-glucan synthetase